MNYIPTNTPIRVEWTVKKGIGNVVEDFSRSEVFLFLETDRDRWAVQCEDKGQGLILAELPNNMAEGVYHVELIWYKGEDALRSIQRTKKECVFAIDENVEHKGNKCVVRIESIAFPYGYDGLNGYDLAIMRGEVEPGSISEAEWANVVKSIADEAAERKSEVARLDSKDAELAASIASEASTRAEADKALSGRITSIEDWHEEVYPSEKSAIYETIASNKASVDSEIARIDRDTDALESAISKNATDIENQKFDADKSIRALEVADMNLQKNIDIEAEARDKADRDFMASLEDEITKRGNDDKVLQQNLNAMDTRVKDLESRLESFYVPSLSVTGGKKVKKGTTQSVTINWTFAFNGAVLTPSTLTFQVGNGAVETLDPSTKSKTVSGITSDTTFTVVADGNAASTSIRFYDPVLWGVVGANFNPIGDNVKNLTDLGVYGKATQTKTITTSDDVNKFCVAAPEGVLSVRIKDVDGTDVTQSSFTLTQASISSVGYNVWTLTNAAYLNGVKYTIEVEEV